MAAEDGQRGVGSAGSSWEHHGRARARARARPWTEDEVLRRCSKRDYRHEVARAASYKQLHWLVAIAAPPAFTDYF